MAAELTSVTHDEAVVFDGIQVVRHDGLQPGTEQVVDGLLFRTLPRPRGQLLSTIATVNDLHFGETVCGHIDGVDLGPPMKADPDDEPYPTVMNRAAVKEISVSEPDAVVAKGDLTASASAAEYGQFEQHYREAFGDRLVVTRGNHDSPSTGGDVPLFPPAQAVFLEGAVIAVLDTSRPGWIGGHVSDEQADWLDELASRAARPVLVFGHHPGGGQDINHLFGPASAGANSLGPNSTRRLVSVINRRSDIVGYFAGHTHRNKVRHLPETGRFPWVEVACVKDFPGAWAEYRVYEGSVVQIHRRIHSERAALEWSERCRGLFGGWYPSYAFGTIEDRCLEIPRG
jgi:Icc protein